MTARAFAVRLAAKIHAVGILPAICELRNQMALWIVAGWHLFAVLFYFRRGLTRSRNYSNLRCLYRALDHIGRDWRPQCAVSVLVEALRPGNGQMPTVVYLLVSLLVMCLGNIMPKFRMNWYCGLKTPWTLSSETVWTKTHRVAGRMLFCGGYYQCRPGSFVQTKLQSLCWCSLRQWRQQRLSDCVEQGGTGLQNSSNRRKWILKARGLLENRAFLI